MKTRIITIIAVLLSLTVGRAADRLQIGNITLKPGEVKDIVLSLSQDKEKYAGVQFDLQLPMGLSLGMTGDEVYYSFAGQQANDMTCNTVKVDEDVYRFMVYSNSLQLLKSGELMTLRIKAENSMTLDEYSLLLNNVMLSDIDGDVTKLGNSTSIVKVTDFFNLIYQVDGEEYKSIKVEYGATITPEAAPTKEGYVFSGWSEVPETMPAEDVTITGSFTYVPPTAYILTYLVDGEVYETISYYEGDVITPESEPMKEGYTFSGWSEIPETMPAHDVTVTGSFTKGMYKLTYVVNGEVYKTISYDYGASITPEPDLMKDGYTFSGWSWIPSKMPAEDVTVTATFTANKYKLIYKVDGEVYKSYDVEYGASLNTEAEPTKEGYTFSGWSWMPSKMPAEDVTVTGSFTINKYKLTYQVDGAEYKTYEVEYGSTITPEPQPEGDYVRFAWVGIPEKMPAHDVTVTADFETGITDVVAKNDIKYIYGPNGKRVNKLQKGVNIVVMKDGTTKKIILKSRP